MERERAYSDLLYESAARWGRTIPPAESRPIIDDDSPLARMLPVVETLRWQPPADKPWAWAEIEVVRLDDRWSFAASFSDSGSGGGFSPFPKFCRPHPSRAAAIEAAADYFRKCGKLSPDLDRWLARLSRSAAQLPLF